VKRTALRRALAAAALASLAAAARAEPPVVTRVEPPSWWPGGPAVVAFNNGPAAAEVELETAPAGLAEGAALRDRLGALPEVAVRGGRIRITLPPRSAAVYLPR
jgi:hypothetical protein